MKIQTTEAVRRFNAQTELVDIALDGAADDVIDPGKLFALLHLTGHVELKRSFEESMRQVCISGTGWPTAAEPADPPPPALMPPIHHTKSVRPHEDWCMCHSCCESDEDQERDHLRNVVERLLNAYAWGRKSTKPEELHAAVRSAMEAIGEL